MNELDAISHRPKGTRSALGGTDWQYIEAPGLDDFSAQDWETLNRQRTPYFAGQQAAQALRMLTASRDDATFGYQINNYEHCLQAATMALRDGLDEETVVVALLHDVGFVACPTLHGEFAAALLGAYISERNYWMLRRHAIFQVHHCRGWQGLDHDERERWRGHAHFEWTARFVERYDQNSIQADYENAKIEEFVPLVQRIFARPPRGVGHPE